MEEITIKRSRRGFILPALLNVALMAYNGGNWYQGHITPATKPLTIVPAVFLALKGVLVMVPMFIRLSGGRFEVRMGFGLNLSTAPENVAALEFRDRRARVHFKDLNQVDAENGFKEFMQQQYSRKGCHVEFPMGSRRETFERLREATLKDRANPDD